MHDHKANLTLVLKDVKLAECLVVSSHVQTVKHKAKHRYTTQKRLFQLLHETNSHSGLYIHV